MNTGIQRRGSLTYVVGDATDPQVQGNKVIAHICNDTGGWGRGFVVALSQRWKEPEAAYRALTPEARQLGTVRFVQVTPGILVCNMIAQHDTVWDGPVPPVRYWAVNDCITEAAAMTRDIRGSLHMPRIGCGLGGGHWQQVEPFVRKAADRCEIDVYVYDLPASST